MSRNLRVNYDLVFAIACMILSPVVVNANDADELTQLLQTFLTGVTEAATHDQFWADDLIYTSSRGTRTTKSEIMQGFANSNDTEEADGGPVYSAEDVQIQLYDDTAIVAFRLVATPADSSDAQEYLNTGTFLKRDGRWQVVAWQATIIPGTIISAQ